jgi:hypothetical protein
MNRRGNIRNRIASFTSSAAEKNMPHSRHWHGEALSFTSLLRSNSTASRNGARRTLPASSWKISLPRKYQNAIREVLAEKGWQAVTARLPDNVEIKKMDYKAALKGIVA